MGAKTKTISVSSEFLEVSKQFNLSWTEAARIGMAFLIQETQAELSPLMEKRIFSVIENATIYKKMRNFQKLLEKASEQIAIMQQTKLSNEKC